MSNDLTDGPTSAPTPDGIRDLTEPREQARDRTVDNPTGAETAVA